MNRSTPGLPVHHQLPEFTQTHVHRVSDANQPSHPLSSPSPPVPNPSQNQSLFQLGPWKKCSPSGNSGQNIHSKDGGGVRSLWLLWSSLKVSGGHILSTTSFKGLANYNPRAKFTGYLVLHGSRDKNGFYVFKQFQKIKRTVCLDTWKFHVCNLNISVHKYSCIRRLPLHSHKYHLWLPSCYNGRAGKLQQRLCGPTKLKILTLCSFTEKVCQACLL